ncbi:hypothetical protein J7643_06975 [bacterium]|nr:hypothetical protein [bacterium]
MKRLILLCLVLVGCQVPQAASPVQTPSSARTAKGTLGVKLLWPERRTQLIPLSTEAIRIRVLKDGRQIAEQTLGRPARNDAEAVGQGTLPLDAASGLTVVAEAFRTNPILSSDLPIASNEARGVNVVANQKTSVTLALAPHFIPVLTSFKPANGGPGVEVTLAGAFGDSPYVGLAIGENEGVGRAREGAIVAIVPWNASSGPVMALADGIRSNALGTFRVLKTLAFDPARKAFSVGETYEFTVPSATDTSGQAVSNPTLTRWEALPPGELNSAIPAPSTVGSIDDKGTFTALAPGEVAIRVYSGAISAYTTITVVD